MPHSSSAKKRLRQNEKSRIRNRAVKSSVRTVIKSLKESVATGQVDEIRSQYDLVQKKLDQAVAKGIFHKNTASRYKARLASLMAKSQAPAE